MGAGLVGVPLGTVLAQTLKRRYPRADPLICAGGLLISAPFLLGSMFLVSVHTGAAYALIFLGAVALNLNWAIVADILLVSEQLNMPIQRPTPDPARTETRRVESATREQSDVELGFLDDGLRLPPNRFA